MPIHVSTVTVHFKDEDEKEIEDATFTIRKRLSHEAQMDYLEAAASFDVDADTGEVKTTLQRLKLKAITDIMVSDALTSWSGVLDAEGNPIPVSDYRKVDAPYLAQVTGEIQRRNAPPAKDQGPKGGAPSASSSKETARKQ